MPTYTTNYNLAKPLVNSAVDQDVWGNELNSDMDIIDSTMKSISDSVTPLATILAAVYPIGSYYLNETDSTNPNTLFGFGTWVAITDKFIVAHGVTYTSTGGVATVTLGSTNLPSFNISIPTGKTVSNSVTGSLEAATTNDATGSPTTIAFTGSATPFSIIPTYQAAYIWKRTA